MELQVRNLPPPLTARLPKAGKLCVIFKALGAGDSDIENKKRRASRTEFTCAWLHPGLNI